MGSSGVFSQKQEEVQTGHSDLQAGPLDEVGGRAAGKKHV